MSEHYSMYIDGKWIDTDEVYEIRSPATEELVATVAKGNTASVDAAVEAAKGAFAEGTWRRTPPAQRAAIINNVAERLGARADELAALQTRENGATIRITGALHVGLSVAQLQYLAAIAENYEWETPGPAIEPVAADGVVVREPLGVVAAIVPWNIPLLTTVWKIGPALVAGNSVVLKPDEHAPLLALELAREFDAAGLPPGVLNVVTGDGEPVGAHLSGHPDVRKVAFTGSTAVGKSILRQSADTVRRVTLELGGKGANIILDDADIDMAVDGALFACMANNGEACEAGTRLLIPASRRDEIVDKLLARASTLRVGDPLDPATHIGPVISQTQRDRILNYFRIAAEEGAIAALGGKARSGPEFDKGYWIEPTIYLDVTNDMRVAREEVFGPVLVVMTYDTDEDALAVANDTNYGLSAGVWGSEERATALARRLEAGMVWVNNWHIIHPAYPFGGYKESGLGREGGPNAIDEYVEEKFIAVDRSGGIENKAFAIVIDPAGD
ncbi:aldehyde dehydrogenase family protein [Mycolicibacterium smegmatis]|jgi:acyl-CoA reductase-like NAD-dependent aldehyde dehydrogenase|uniref:Aldehyde dehydrogenase n=3 Tax=Mycolicibacterium smegmatis TaxID=1772 RepID=A0QPA2_MYCS2|nr:aldehyde dehydrogenase family protein [Mycolicibacterium smegmatis]ABK74396.1 aldehyde dehydrogenase [Mycolicibacterium smegmatis MC2 155]AFP36801.1 Betaine-aldehyde dehydrogenase [Mycolicibacterium smegmatis MC2 155]AIU05605.1 aldehyde dehydrogenase [Mycolicibacterium smegmatis MC2 155]AIU12230.1 aldehyde dehydrogenase [Mycolicibacterium smegmatis]AIU18854.1 aldehyde dehydrogenase [Mycolicibacterium smegmatis]